MPRVLTNPREAKEAQMNTVGIDLHRNRSHVAVIDGTGELSLSRRIVNDRETFLELLGGLEGESQVAVEATYGWEWLAELLEDAGYEIHLAHPLLPTSLRANCATCASCCGTGSR
jgi:hypothetical protein